MSVKVVRERNMPAGESRLLQQINLGISATWQRYQELKAKRRAETLSQSEQEELIAISDEIEQANARRLQALAQLTILRQTTVDAPIDKLGYGNSSFD